MDWLPSLPEITDFVERVGVPCAILVPIFLGAYVGVRALWRKTSVWVDAIVSGHCAHLKTSQEAMCALRDCFAELAGDVKQSNAHTKDALDELRRANNRPGPGWGMQ